MSISFYLYLSETNPQALTALLQAIFSILRSLVWLDIAEFGTGRQSIPTLQGEKTMFRPLIQNHITPKDLIAAVTLPGNELFRSESPFGVPEDVGRALSLWVLIAAERIRRGCAGCTIKVNVQGMEIPLELSADYPAVAETLKSLIEVSHAVEGIEGVRDYAWQPGRIATIQIIHWQRQSTNDRPSCPVHYGNGEQNGLSHDQNHVASSSQ